MNYFIKGVVFLKNIFLIVSILIIIFYAVCFQYLKNKSKYLLNYFQYHIYMSIFLVASINLFFNKKVFFIVVIFLIITLLNTVRIVKWLVDCNNKNFYFISLYLIESFFIIIVLYANIYKNFDSLFSKEKLSIVDAIYYSITTFTTTGYGDIYPIHDITKIIVNSEMIIGYFFSAIVVAIIVSKFLDINSKHNDNEYQEREKEFVEDYGELSNETEEILIHKIKRYQKIVKDLKKKYNNRCQIDGYSFTFEKKNGESYSEAHYLHPLSQGGSRKAHNVVILCSNHHRMLHYAKIDIGKFEENKKKIIINGQVSYINY